MLPQRPVSASRRHTSPVGARYAESKSTPSAPAVVVSVGRLGGGYPTSSTARTTATLGSSVRTTVASGGGSVVRAAPISTSSRRSVPSSSPQRMPSVSRLSSVSSTSYVSSHISLLGPTPARGARASSDESRSRNLARVSPVKAGTSPARSRFSSPAPQPKVSSLRAFSSSPKRLDTISQLVRGVDGLGVAHTSNINNNINTSSGSPAVAALKQHYAAYLRETDDIFHSNPSQKEVISRLHAKVVQLTEALEGMQTVDLVNHQLRLDIGRLEHENKTLREAVQILTRRQKEEDDKKVKDATVICELKRSLAGASQKDQISKAASTKDSKTGGSRGIAESLGFLSQGEGGDAQEGEVSTVGSSSTVATLIGVAGSSSPPPRMSATTANLMKALSAMSGQAKAALKTYENTAEKAGGGDPLHADRTRTPRASSGNPSIRRAGSAPPPLSTFLSPATHQQQTQATRRSATPTNARHSAAFAKATRQGGGITAKTPPPPIIKKREGSQTQEESRRRFQSPTVSSKLKDAVAVATTGASVHSPLPAQTSSSTPNGHPHRQRSSSYSASPTRHHATPPRADLHDVRGGHSPTSESREPTLSGDSLPHCLPAAYHQPYHHNLNRNALISEGGHRQHKTDEDYDDKRVKPVSGGNDNHSNKNSNDDHHRGFSRKGNNASARTNSSEIRRREREKGKEVTKEGSNNNSRKVATGRYSSSDDGGGGGGGGGVEGVVAGRPIGLPPSALTEGYLRAKFKSFPNSAVPSVRSVTPPRSAASSRTPSSAAAAAFAEGTPVVVRGYSPPLLMHPQPSHGRVAGETSQWAMHANKPPTLGAKELFPREDDDEEKFQEGEREKKRRLSSGSGVLNLQATMQTTSPRRTPMRMEAAHLLPVASDAQLTSAVNSHHFYANDSHGTAGTSFASSEGAASRRRGSSSFLNITPVEPLSVGETEERYRKTVLMMTDVYGREEGGRNEMMSTTTRTGRSTGNNNNNNNNTSEMTTNKSGNNSHRGVGGEKSATEDSGEEGVTNSIFADPESAVALLTYSSSRENNLLRHQSPYLKVANTIINSNKAATEKEKGEGEGERERGGNTLDSNGTERRIGVAIGGGESERFAVMNKTQAAGGEERTVVRSGGVSVGGGVVTLLKVRESPKESEGLRQAAATIGSRDLLVPPPPRKSGSLTTSSPHRQHKGNMGEQVPEKAGGFSLHSLSSSAARIQLVGGASRATTTTIEKKHTTTRMQNRSPNKNTVERRRVDRSLSSSSARTTQSLPSEMDHFSRLAVAADDRSVTSTGDERTMIAELSNISNRNSQRPLATSSSFTQREEHRRRQQHEHQLRTRHYLQQAPPEKENMILPTSDAEHKIGGAGRSGGLAPLAGRSRGEGTASSAGSSAVSVMSSSSVVEVSALTAAEEERTARRRVKEKEEKEEEEYSGEGSLSNPSASLLSSRTARFEEHSSDALRNDNIKANDDSNNNNNNRDRRTSDHSYSARSNGEEDGRWSAVAGAHEGSRTQSHHHRHQQSRFLQEGEGCDGDDGDDEEEEGEDYGENDEEFVMFY